MRPGYANIVATLALFIALGGTSWAAVKITGANVKDGSLTGRDVKNGSLTGRDIKNRSIAPRHLKKKVTGKRGPAGPRGSRGIAGPQGKRGPSSATFVHGAPALLTGNSPKTVATLDLPAGRWMLGVSAMLKNETTAQSTAYCELRFGRDESDLEIVTSTGDLLLRGEFGKSTEVISLDTGIITDSPGIVALTCNAEPAEASVRKSVITAIETAELTDQTDESQFPI